MRRQICALLLLLSLASACQELPAQDAPATTQPAASQTPAERPGATADAPQATPAASPAPGGTSRQPALQELFEQAAGEFGVPVELLLSVSYNLSRWEQHSGETSTTGGYGLMHLPGAAPPFAEHRVGSSRRPLPGGEVDGLLRTGVTEQDDEETGAEPVLLDPARPSLRSAAMLLGLPEALLMQDARHNLRGGAALLASYARDGGALPPDIAGWYGAVARYSGSQERGIALGFADLVYQTMRQGATRTTSEGQRVSLAPQAVKPNIASAAGLTLRDTALPQADCPPDLACRFIPATYQRVRLDDPEDYANYDLAERPGDGLSIDYIVIHNSELPDHKTLLHFQQPWSYVSAHYSIRAADGLVTQQVDNSDVARTAGNWYINAHSINIEHEGYAIEGAAWYSEAMYRASSRLVRHLAEKYGVPLDRAHIIGHDEVAGPTLERQSRMHWDPGPFWDWAHYMQLLGAPLDAEPEPEPGSSVVVTILPDFAANTPELSYCTYLGCRPLPRQPSSALRLYSAPDLAALPLDDPALEGPGSAEADDWGAQALSGQKFVVAETRGDWVALWFGGQLAWLHDPLRDRLRASQGLLVSPREGLDSIPVYGRPFPESVRYADTPLQYRIAYGQSYVATRLVTGDEYAPEFGRERGRLIGGNQQFYQIFFNHRMAFVRVEDVEAIEQ